MKEDPLSLLGYLSQSVSPSGKIDWLADWAGSLSRLSSPPIGPMDGAMYHIKIAKSYSENSDKCKCTIMAEKLKIGWNLLPGPALQSGEGCKEILRGE